MVHTGYHLNINDSPLSATKDRCPFIASGSTAIAWDGNLSPCLALVHNHYSYLGKFKRALRRYVVGNIREHDLPDLWNQPDYIQFRERVQRFDFPPCTACGGCEMIPGNLEDCYGNPFPTCGGCLWAQGIVQCP
jgi:radical SAM protein with 4Fe4S-binding SPASM domain